MTTAWHSPGSIYTLGHKAVTDIFKVPVQIQEKVDGSFFAFGLFPEIDLGEGPLRIRSKGAVMHPDAPEKMFTKAAEAVKARLHLLREGWQYRGEYLAKPKHNSLAYDRAPKSNIILFDVCTGEEDYLPYEDLVVEAARLDLEVVPQLKVYEAGGGSLTSLQSLLDTTSILGGQKIEGVVIKPLTPLYGVDKKLLMGKFVSEAYKEVHSKAWKEGNPTSKDIIALLGDKYNTPARWNKAIQHMREAGLINDDLTDIGKIMKEIPEDVLKEEGEAMKEEMWRWAWPHIRRNLSRGFPAFYKEMLLRRQFDEEGTP